MTAVVDRISPRPAPVAAASRHWEEPPVLVAVAVMVLAAVWLGTLAGPSRPGDGSAEAGFVRDMAVHHAQAVGMAELVRFRTEDPAVRTLATDIALTQQAQIGQVRGWLEQWGLPFTGRSAAMAWMGHPVTGAMPGMATPAQVRAIATAPPGQADVLFLQAMIPHHRAAVAMAQAVLGSTDRPEVRRLAEGVVAAQQSEITVMEALLRRKGASTRTEPVAMPAVQSAEHGGFFGDLGRAARSTARLAPISAGLLAAGWLAADGASRRRRWLTGRRAAGGEGPWRWVAGGGLAAAGALHLGLAPTHFEEAAAYGVFFVGAGVVQLALAPIAVVSPGRLTGRVVAATSVILLAVYMLYRVVAPPGAAETETVDAVGAMVQAVQVAVVAAGVMLARRAAAVGVPAPAVPEGED